MPINVSLNELQKMVKSLSKRTGYDRASPTTLALGLTEETGEVARDVLRYYTPDYTLSPHSHNSIRSAKDTAYEIGDCITYLLALCNAIGIEPEFKWIDEGE